MTSVRGEDIINEVAIQQKWQQQGKQQQQRRMVVLFTSALCTGTCGSGSYGRLV